MSEHAATTRQSNVVRVSIVGIAGNIILVVFKAIVGKITGSVAIVADAVNNLADALSSVVTIIGTKLAAKAPNREHPYGYGQIEYLSSAIIGLLILYTGITTFTDSFEKILHPENAHYDAAAIIVIVAGIAVKLLLGRYFRKKGSELESEALTASGADAALDAAVSSLILVGAAVTWIWGVSIDGWLGAAIALVILKSALDVLKESLSRIIGERVPAEFAKKLKAEIRNHPEVMGVYDLILNRYGPERSIGSVHIQVPDEMTAIQIDSLSRKITADLYSRYGIIMTVGIYAANRKSPTARAMLETLRSLTAQYPEILQLHGFYVDDETKNVSFDMVLDFGSKDREKVRNEIVDRMRAEYPCYTFNAVLDADFSD